MSNWAEIPEKGNYFYLTVVRVLVETMPRRLLHWGACVIAFFFLIIDTHARKSSKEFLTRVKSFTTTSDKAVGLFELQQHFSHFAKCLLDKFYAWIGRLNMPDCSFFGKDEFTARLRSKNGSILLGAHFGNIEILRAIGMSTFQYKINALMYNANAVQYNNTLKALNSESLTRIIEIDQAGPELIFELNNLLDEGEVVSMLGDRLTPGAPEKSFSLPFLGKEAKFPMGPFLIAAMLDFPIFVVFPVLIDGRYNVYFEKIELSPEDNSSRAKKKALKIAERYVQRLEHYAKQYPYNWFNFYDFWK